MNRLARFFAGAGIVFALISGCVSQTPVVDTVVPTVTATVETALPPATVAISESTSSPTTGIRALGRLIFSEVTTFNTEDSNPLSSTLSVIQADGGGYSRVLENSGFDGLHMFMAVSPDGSSLLTNDYHPGGPDSPAGLVVVNLHNWSASRVAPNDIDATYYRIWEFGPPAWSSDSLHLITPRGAFGGSERRDFGLVDVSLRDNRLESLTFVEEGTHWSDRWASVSPEGTHIAFVRYLYDPASGAHEYPGAVIIGGTGGDSLNEIATAIPFNFYSREHGLFQFFGPVWSPDSAKLAFFSYEDSTQTLGLGIFDVAKNALAITPLRPGHYADLSWSPDSARLVFSGDFEGNDELYTFSLGDQVPVNVSGNSASDINPTWSPDGDTIAFVSDRENPRQYKLYLLNVETLQSQRLLDALVMWRPAWLPNTD